MMLIWSTIYLACLLAVGYGAAAIFRRGDSRIGRFGLAACLGSAILGFILIAISLSGCPPNRAVILCAAAIGIATAVGRRPRKPVISSPRLPRTSLAWLVLCLVAIAYGIFASGQDAFLLPAVERDAYSIWQLKAKVLAIHALLPRPDYFTDLSLSYSHLRYPILVPMISAGLHAMTGRLDDELGKTPSLLLYLGLGAAIYAAIQSRRGVVPAITATALLLTTPTILGAAGSGTADMTLTAFYGCSIVYLLRWQEEKRFVDLALCLIFTAAMAWTKNEGMILALINVAAIAALTPRPWSPRQFCVPLGFLFGVALLVAPWIIYSHNLPATDENYPTHLNPRELAANIARLPYIAHSLCGDLINWRHWGFFWLALAVVAIPQPRAIPHGPIRLLWILLLLHILAYIPFYMVTPWQLPYLMPYSQSRLLLHATPTVALLIGLLWPRNSGMQPQESAH
jgi:4-amino-4-deoxy-L-arabinose transferase-like glycosyltransferase